MKSKYNIQWLDKVKEIEGSTYSIIGHKHFYWPYDECIRPKHHLEKKSIDDAIKWYLRHSKGHNDISHVRIYIEYQPKWPIPIDLTAYKNNFTYIDFWNNCVEYCTDRVIYLTPDLSRVYAEDFYFTEMTFCFNYDMMFGDFEFDPSKRYTNKYCDEVILRRKNNTLPLETHFEYTIGKGNDPFSIIKEGYSYENDDPTEVNWKLISTEYNGEKYLPYCNVTMPSLYPVEYFVPVE